MRRRGVKKKEEEIKGRRRRVGERERNKTLRNRGIEEGIERERGRHGGMV